MMYTVWLLSSHITKTEIDQLYAANITIDIRDYNPPVEIKTLSGTVPIQVFAPDVIFHTETEKQELLLKLLFGDKVQMIGHDHAKSW